MTYVPEGDILLNDTSLLSNSTFNMDALGKTMEYLTITNFWNLYKVQRTKLGVQRYDIPFADFVLESRLPGQTDVKYYPKRYVYYINYRMVPTGRREKYRRSDLYQKEMNQEDISVKDTIFSHNFLVFIGNDLINTCEVYPWEDKLGVCIDVATVGYPHGVPIEKYDTYREENPMVSIYFVPNYKIQKFSTTINTIHSYGDAIPLSRITSVGSLTSDTLFFCNTTTDTTALRLLPNVHYDESVDSILFDTTGISEDVSNVTVWCFDFPYMHIQTISSDIHYLEMDTLMPCPTENLMILSNSLTTGEVKYDSSIKTTLYYPNIYKIDGNDEDTNYMILTWYNDDFITDREEYEDDLAVYRECYNLLEDHMNGDIEELVKDYRPSQFTYSEGEYEASIYVPNIINYKVAKLREYIETYPGLLNEYWRILGIPNEKYYLDMTLFDLDDRRRTDTSKESPELETNITLPEESYVFSMRREFKLTKDYDFRIFVDGYLLNLNQYRIMTGLNFYFIYIPVKYIKEDTLIEIERFRYYVDVHEATLNNLNDYINYIPRVNSIVQARDIFLYNTTNMEFIDHDKYKLEHYSSYLEDWVEIPTTSAYCVSGEQIRISLMDSLLLGVKLGYGINQNSYMETGEVFTSGEGETLVGLEYTKVDVTNYGNYDKSSYRVFNNGKFCVPAQYYIHQTKIRGGVDSVRTKCIVRDGDQFTVDHVPGTYRTVIFIKDIGDNGYIDLDGKIPLPLNFKWYDMYLNGVRLNRNMVDFISETKCYIHGINSTKNFVIMERNHDDDMFYLTSFAYKKPGYSKSIMDELFTLVKEIKDTFDSLYSVIDNADQDMLEGGILAEDSLLDIIIFEEYLQNYFLNSNTFDPPVLEEIRNTYPDAYSGGRYHISGNEHYDAELVKYIDCNAVFKNI